MANLRSARIFRLSSFNSNHRQMIIRSDPEFGPDASERIEIYFGNVEYVAMRPLLSGIDVRRASADERSLIRERYGIERNLDYAFILDIGPPLNFVISGNPSWREAVRAVDEPSLFDFADSRNAEVATRIIE